MTELLENTNAIASNSRIAGNMKSAIRCTPAESLIEADPNLVTAARRYWMTKAGIPQEVIEEHCNLAEYPGTIEEEMEEIAALAVVEELNRQIKWNV